VNTDGTKTRIPADNEPLAMWAFFTPDRIDRVAKMLKRVSTHDLYSGKKLGEETLRKLQNRCPEDVVIFYQRHGEEVCIATRIAPHPLSSITGTHTLVQVYVAPAWPHTVINLLPNFKVAYDFFEDDQVAAYITGWKLIGSKFKNKAEDFMGINRAVFEHVARRAHALQGCVSFYELVHSRVH
jgi:hypothetical protein